LPNAGQTVFNAVLALVNVSLKLFVYFTPEAIKTESAKPVQTTINQFNKEVRE